MFCENSGADLESLRTAATGQTSRVDFLSFTADYEPERGRGYGEGLILRHALEHSDHVGPDSRVLKVTGRLYIRNVAQIIDGARARTSPAR